MPETELHIKNMVCDRCIKVVKEVMEQLHLPVKSIELGKVVLANNAPDIPKEKINDALLKEGFELIEDKKHRIVEAIKNAVIERVHHQDLSEQQYNFSTYLGEKLHLDYHYLSSIFSELENVTVEQYIILQKIEKVKEWLLYDELSLSEIAYRMGYSSVAHLSAQFKKVTGFTPTRFRELKEHKRKPLDQVGE
jgi:AraC family transcriptional regulator